MSLRRLGFVEVPAGVRPGFDHADVFRGPGGSWMYVAHTGADRIEVLDCKLGSHLRTLGDHPGVAGVLIDSERDLLLATDRACARLSLHRCSDESLLAQVAVGPHPNAIALDTRRLHAYTFDLGEPLGVSCAASVVDVATRAILARVPLPGRPRWALFDRSTDAVYANIADPPLIVAIDAGLQMITRTMSVPASGPHGLARVDGALFCAADAGELVVLERDSGAVRARLPLAGAPDVVVHDPALARLYVAVGSPGVVHSFDTRRLALVETVQTEEGAHTIGWDPATRRLFAFAPRSCGAIVFEEAA